MAAPSITTDYRMHIILGIYAAYTLICLGLLIARRNHEPVRSRGWQLVLVQVCWGIIDASFGCLQTGDSPVFCWVVMWIEPLFIPLICIPHILRAIMLYHLYTWNRRKLHPKADDAQVVSRYRLFTSMKFNFAILAVTVVVTVVTVAGVRLSAQPPMQLWGMPEVCFVNITNITIAQAAISVALFLYCIYLLWDSQDGFHFKTELKIFAIVFPIFYTWFAVVALMDLLPTIWNSLTPMMGSIITTTIACLYPVYLSYRREWRVEAVDEEQAERLPTEFSEDELEVGVQRPVRPDFKSTADLFMVILKNPVLLLAFRKFALDLWCVENLLFYEAAEAFTQIHDEQEQRTQAQLICNLYIKPDALREINVDDAPRQRVLDRVAKDNISPDMFEQLKAAVFHQMRLDTFAKFRLSDAFRNAWGDAGFGRAPVFRKVGGTGGSGTGERTSSTNDGGDEEEPQIELVNMSTAALELLRESTENLAE